MLSRIQFEFTYAFCYIQHYRVTTVLQYVFSGFRRILVISAITFRSCDSIIDCSCVSGRSRVRTAIVRRATPRRSRCQGDAVATVVVATA